MIVHRVDGHRTGSRPPGVGRRLVRSIAGLATLAGVAGLLPAGLPIGAAPAAAVVARAAPPRAEAAAFATAAKDPKLCRGCAVYVLNVPLEPTRATFGPEPNSTVEVRAKVPGNWSRVSCGDEYRVVARDATTADGLAVAGWGCREHNNTLHFSGPPAGQTSGSAVRFLFRAKSPGPTASAFPLAARFVEVTQTYLDGEQQRRRGAKQLVATRSTASSGKDATVWLPPNWVAADCGVPFNAAGEPVTGWTCGLDALAGAEFRVRWTRTSGRDAARLFYFHAFTKDPRPRPVPLSFAGVTKVTDLMFDDGQIPTVLVAHLRPGDPPPTPKPSPTARPEGEHRESRHQRGKDRRDNDNDRDECLPAGVYSTATPQPGGVDFPYAPPPGYPGFGWYGYYGDPCVPPRVVIDPCAGKYFGEYGDGRFTTRRKPVASACLPPEERAPEPTHAQEPLDPAQECVLAPEHRPEADRPDRSYHRPVLRPSVAGETPLGTDPDGPPVVLVPPDDRSAARPSLGSDDRVLVIPRASPQPSIRALLPTEPDAAEAPTLQDCAQNLPATGGRSTPVLQLALGALAIGAALVFGALYWRRRSSHERWYSGY